LNLKKAFRISAGSAEKVRNGFFMIENESCGEISRSVYYGPKPEEIERDAVRAVEYLQLRSLLDRGTLDELDAMDLVAPVKAGVIAAVLNYLSMTENEYPWRLLDLETPAIVKTSFTIGIDTIPSMIEAIRKSPYPILKIKLGFEGEQDLIKELRSFPDRLFRFDANGAWNTARAEEMMYYLADLNVDIMEQPTGLEFVKEWKYLKKLAGFKLVIDEGMNSLGDYCKYADFVDGINIKMSKVGGILEALRIARLAKSDRCRVMLGCMVESSIGIAPAVYMSSLGEYFDLDGPLLLEKDLSDDIEYMNEKMSLRDSIIGGPRLKKEFNQ